MTNTDWYALIVYVVIVIIAYFAGIYWFNPEKERRRHK